MKKFKVEVIADSSGEWSSNRKTFDTREEAHHYGVELMERWTLVEKWRVVEVEEPPRRIRLT